MVPGIRSYAIKSKGFGWFGALEPNHSVLEADDTHVVKSANVVSGPVAAWEHAGPPELMLGLLAADVKSKLRPSQTTVKLVN